MHKSITWERVEEAVEESMFGNSYPGFCLLCGDDADGCEPDAEEYECLSCGAFQVMGAENVMIMEF